MVMLKLIGDVIQTNTLICLVNDSIAMIIGKMYGSPPQSAFISNVILSQTPQ